MFSGGEVNQAGNHVVRVLMDQDGNVTKLYPDQTNTTDCPTSHVHPYDRDSIRMEGNDTYFTEACTNDKRALTAAESQLLHSTRSAIDGAIAYFRDADSMKCEWLSDMPLGYTPPQFLNCFTDSGKINFTDADGNGVYESMSVYIKAKDIASQGNGRETMIYATMPTNAEMQKLASSRIKNTK